MSARGNSLELYVQSYKDIVKSIGEDFTDPDDDWRGMLILEGEEARHLIPLDFKNDAEKEVYATRLIPLAILKFKPSIVAEVLSAWTVEGHKDSDVLDVRPSQHPRRKEVVVLTVFSLEDVQLWMAEILRSESDPPKLGPWKLHSYDGFTGQFVDPVRRAMKLNEEGR